MPKHAPPREDGLKPWVVTISSWGKKHETIVYSTSASSAVSETVGRQQHTYGKGRRATNWDVKRLARTGRYRWPAHKKKGA